MAEGRPVVLVVPRRSERLRQVARGLAAAELVRTSTPALESDRIAARELAGRLDDLDRQLAVEIERAFAPDGSVWHAGDRTIRPVSWRDVSRAVSDLCDRCYPAAPPIRNELLNRRTLSTSAARARRNLVEAMILHGGEPRFGFEGHPPELSMYRSLLEAGGLHRRRGAAWGFGAPGRNTGMRPVWDAIGAYLQLTETGRRPLSDLYEGLRRPPFGLRDGPLPVIVVAALIAYDQDVALYENGSFVPAWTPSLAERLLRSPLAFEVRQSRLDGARSAALQHLSAALSSLSLSLSLSLQIPRQRCSASCADWCDSWSGFRPAPGARAGFPIRLARSGKQWSGRANRRTCCSTPCRRRAVIRPSAPAMQRPATPFAASPRISLRRSVSSTAPGRR